MDNGDRDFQLADEIEQEVSDRLVRRWSRNMSFGKQITAMVVSILIPVAGVIGIYYSFKSDIKDIQNKQANDDKAVNMKADRNRGAIEIIWYDFYGRKLPP